MPNMAASVGAGFTAWTSVGPVIREEKNIIEGSEVKIESVSGVTLKVY